MLRSRCEGARAKQSASFVQIPDEAAVLGRHAYWLTSARIDRARVPLETTDEAIEQLGRLTGLGAPASLRASFHRHLATSPQEYRILFRHSRSIANTAS